jgi:hypothetical protein
LGLVRPNPDAPFAFEQLAEKLPRGWCRRTTAGVPVKSEEFMAEPGECRAVIDIVPSRQKMDRQTDLLSSRDCLFENTVGAPVDFFEQAAMEFLQANQIIAAII